MKCYRWGRPQSHLAADRHFLFGDRELQQDEKAIADYEKALEAGLSGHIALIRRAGEFLDKVGKHEKAILFFDHDVQMHPMACSP